MTPRFRKFLAASQIAGAAAVLYEPFDFAATGFIVEWWYWVAMLGLGGLAVMAGLWLWRDDALGWGLSPLLQALQIVQFQTSSFVLSIKAGLQLPLTISGMGTGLGVDFEGDFTIGSGTDMFWYVSINLFSLYALYALLRYGPGSATAPDRDSRWWSPRDDPDPQTYH